MIQIYRLTMRYPSGVEALRDISLQVQRGEVACITGRSGSGKSTLMALLAAEMQPTEGQIIVSGRNLSVLKDAQKPAHRRHIGRLWQEPRLLHDRNIAENIALPLEILGQDKKQISQRVAEVLEWVDLSRHAQSRPSWLSSFEQQRAAFARAIVHSPSLILADEPAGKLDPEAAQELLSMCADLKAHDMTVILSTRQPEWVDTIPCDRLITLNQGFLIEERAQSNHPQGAEV